MKWRIGFELIFPTLLVGLCWLGVSLATSAYISWMERRHASVLNENVVPIRAASQMQHALVLLRESWDPEAVELFRAALAAAESAATTDEELRVVTEIRDAFHDYTRDHRSLPHNSTASREARLHAQEVQISQLCHQVQNLNQSMIDAKSAEHRRWSGWVVGARILIVVAGPLVGVWLGFRAANRVKRRLAAIHVRLEGTAYEVGKVDLTPRSTDADLDDIESQVNTIAARLNKVVSDLDAARRESAQNERLAAIGQLAAGVAHELRNPLTAVKLLVQSAARKAPAATLKPEQLTVIQDEIGRMEQTIQSLLDLARPAATERVTCDLRESIHRAINLLQGRAEHDNIGIEVEGDDSPLLVLCDPKQIHQVFVNLLLNGMDVMPGGGTLRVQTRVIPAAGGAECEVSVVDEGPGIPPALLDRIFEPFVTSKSRGTGLGLAISRRLVECNDGRLLARNRAERGAELIVRLPLVAAGNAAALPRSSVTSRPGPPRHQRGDRAPSSDSLPAGGW